MTYALLGLIYSSFSSLFLLLGVGTAINKSGDFFKILENENEDNFKRAFDKTASDLAEDFNKSFESVNLIASNLSKIWILFWELLIGEKFLKKTKDGKLVVDDKNIIFDDYKSKISSLNSKIKKYKEILEKSNLKENINSDDEDQGYEEDSNNSSGDEIEEINAD